MAVSEPVPKGLRLPFEVRVERRLTVPRWLPALTSILALIVAFIIGGIVIWFAGGEPIRSYGHIVDAAFGSMGVFNDTLVRATPLISGG